MQKARRDGTKPLRPLVSTRFQVLFHSPSGALFSFPPVTQMFQFTGLPPPALFDSGRGTRALPRVGFPIRTSRDQRLVSTSSGLIAAAHVLHRLLAPRHPPCALVLLIRKNTHDAAMEFSRCTRAHPPREEPPEGRSLKTQQRTSIVEVDVVSRRAESRTANRAGHRRAQRLPE